MSMYESFSNAGPGQRPLAVEEGTSFKIEPQHFKVELPQVVKVKHESDPPAEVRVLTPQSSERARMADEARPEDEHRYRERAQRRERRRAEAPKHPEPARVKVEEKSNGVVKHEEIKRELEPPTEVRVLTPQLIEWARLAEEAWQDELQERERARHPDRRRAETAEHPELTDEEIKGELEPPAEVRVLTPQLIEWARLAEEEWQDELLKRERRRERRRIKAAEHPEPTRVEVQENPNGSSGRHQETLITASPLNPDVYVPRKRKKFQACYHIADLSSLDETSELFSLFRRDTMVRMRNHPVTLAPERLGNVGADDLNYYLYPITQMYEKLREPNLPDKEKIDVLKLSTPYWSLHNDMLFAGYYGFLNFQETETAKQIRKTAVLILQSMPTEAHMPYKFHKFHEITCGEVVGDSLFQYSYPLSPNYGGPDRAYRVGYQHAQGQYDDWAVINAEASRLFREQQNRNPS
ncbi:hypothetical protein C8J56DRAFT_886883 [Mycena floridula]|nr:hypothetical protein C8J56DRAFT_886883 [Mycena floridula]